MKELIAILDAYTFANDSFSVKWRLTDECNYRCSYCLRNSAIQLGEKRDQKQDELVLCQAAIDIAEMLNKNPIANNVKVDIIGGEPSIYNLKKIFEGLIENSKKIKHINITTNISQSVEYYLSLYNYVLPKNIKLTMTASFHPEFVSIEKYFEKIQKIKNEIGSEYINCEMVSKPDNQDIVKKFREKVLDLQVDYKIEKDIRFKIDETVIVESSVKDKVYYYKYNKNKQSIKWSLIPKKGYNICNGRYLLIFKNSEPEVCKTRSELFLRNDIPLGQKPNFLNTMNFYCNNSIKFINILYNKITSCRTLGIQKNIPDFTFYDWDQSMCEPGRLCTICGQISISKELSLLK